MRNENIKTKTAKRKTVKTRKEAATNAANRNGQINGSRPKRKPLTTEEITPKAFQKVYESHHQETA